LVATIEVKWADKWTYGQLLDSLESQLVGKYMRDNSSQRGVLLLGHSGGKECWRPPDGEELNFNDIVEALRKEAARIANSQAHVSALSVLGIEFGCRHASQATTRV
jgi:hypothetical protein